MGDPVSGSDDSHERSRRFGDVNDFHQAIRRRNGVNKLQRRKRQAAVAAMGGAYGQGSRREQPVDPIGGGGHRIPVGGPHPQARQRIWAPGSQVTV